MLNNLAIAISRSASSHFWMPILVIILSYQEFLLNGTLALFTTTLVIFLILIPFLFITRLIRQHRITDWDMRERTQRLIAAPVFLASISIALFISQFFVHPEVAQQLIFLFVVSAASTIITQFWKVSLHMTINTAGIIIINEAFNWNLVWLFLLLPAVAWSRYYLKHHTFHQLLTGVSLVMAIALLMF